MQAQAAAMATLPAETQMKLKRASWANFTCSMLQVRQRRCAHALQACMHACTIRRVRSACVVAPNHTHRSFNTYSQLDCCCCPLWAPSTPSADLTALLPQPQLACSVAVIILVRYQLETASLGFFPSMGGGTQLSANYQCLMSSQWPGACQYAYSVASISILLNFVLSLMQVGACVVGAVCACVFV